MRRLVKISETETIVLDGNLKSCAACTWKLPWQNYCRRFKCSIKRLNQRNGGFHHHRCYQCMEAECFYDEFANNEIEQSCRFYGWKREDLTAD